MPFEKGPVTALVAVTDRRGHPFPAFRAPSPLTQPMVGVGLSLTDPIFHGGLGGDPAQPSGQGVGWVANQLIGSNTSQIWKSTIPGAPARKHWTDRTTNDPRLLASRYALMMLTTGYTMMLPEANASEKAALLTEHLMFAQHWWTFANGGAGGEILLWSNWGIRGGSTADWEVLWSHKIAEYERVMDHCNLQRPANRLPLRIIPGVQMFRQFHLDIAAGTAPATFTEFFNVDQVHVNRIGSYACIIMHMACVFGIDPVTLPTSIPNLETVDERAPTVEEAQYVQGVASAVVKAYPRSGVDTSAWA